MLLEAGDKLLVVHRRLFEKDEPRFFVGTVEAYEQGMARVLGYSFLRDKLGGSVARKEDLRTKIFSLASGTLLVYQLPEDVTMDSLQFKNEESMIVLTDGQRFSMNLSEWTARTVG